MDRKCSCDLELSSLNTAGKDEKTREENLVLRQNLAMMGMGIIFMTASVATADDVAGSDIPVPSSAGSVAEDEVAPDYARRGVYLELDGQAMVNVFRGGEPGDAASGGVGARAGWHVGSRVAVELQYEWIDQLQNDSANLMTINGKSLHPYRTHSALRPRRPRHHLRRCSRRVLDEEQFCGALWIRRRLLDRRELGRHRIRRLRAAHGVTSTVSTSSPQEPASATAFRKPS